MSTVELRGTGLFSGRETTVAITKAEGPTTLHMDGKGGTLDAWTWAPEPRTTAIALATGEKLACVEHLFAALAALGAYRNVAVAVSGAELPILDGGARAWCDEIATLDFLAAPPTLVVAKEEEIVLGESRYRFAVGDAVGLSVSVDFAQGGPFAASLPTSASWDGSRIEFIYKIAEARTFLFARELSWFAEHASSHAPPESVVVLGEDGAKFAGNEFSSDEPVRHKLLDLIGDAFLYGGPPRGTLHAHRPGHAKNHEALGLALARGILVRA